LLRVPVDKRREKGGNLGTPRGIASFLYQSPAEGDGPT